MGQFSFHLVTPKHVLYPSVPSNGTMVEPRPRIPVTYHDQLSISVYSSHISKVLLATSQSPFVFESHMHYVSLARSPLSFLSSSLSVAI